MRKFITGLALFAVFAIAWSAPHYSIVRKYISGDGFTGDATNSVTEDSVRTVASASSVIDTVTIPRTYGIVPEFVHYHLTASTTSGAHDTTVVVSFNRINNGILERVRDPIAGTNLIMPADTNSAGTVVSGGIMFRRTFLGDSVQILIDNQDFTAITNLRSWWEWQQ